MTTTPTPATEIPTTEVRAMDVLETAKGRFLVLEAEVLTSPTGGRSVQMVISGGLNDRARRLNVNPAVYPTSLVVR